MLSADSKQGVATGAFACQNFLTVRSAPGHGKGRERSGVALWMSVSCIEETLAQARRNRNCAEVIASGPLHQYLTVPAISVHLSLPWTASLKTRRALLWICLALLHVHGGPCALTSKNTQTSKIPCQALSCHGSWSASRCLWLFQSNGSTSHLNWRGQLGGASYCTACCLHSMQLFQLGFPMGSHPPLVAILFLCSQSCEVVPPWHHFFDNPAALLLSPPPTPLQHSTPFWTESIPYHH